MMTKEQIVDRISELLIHHFSTIYTNQELKIEQFQKIIVRGAVVKGTEGTDNRLVAYKEDMHANDDDKALIDWIYQTQSLADDNPFGAPGGLSPDQMSLNVGDPLNPQLIIGVHSLNIADLYNSGIINNEVIFSDNISQFVTFEDEQTQIDPNKAKEILDTHIFELLPSRMTRQERIDKFFKEYNILKGEYPNYTDTDADGIPEPYDDYENPYDSWHDISYVQDNPDFITIPEAQSYITRLENSENQNNTGQSLEWLRNDITLFLNDIDSTGPGESLDIEDNRPIYENKSNGFLEFRDLNQSVIVRNPEGKDIGLEQEMTVTRPDGTEFTGPRWQAQGFSIAMWVRFKDRVNSGTLFNYGNPLRKENPYGFMLDTFVLNKDDPYRNKDSEGFLLENPPTWQEYIEGQTGDLFSESNTYFKDNNYERFIRLVVRDEHSNIMDSHVGKEKRRGRVSLSREQTLEYKWDGSGITNEDVLSTDVQQTAVGTHIIGNHQVPGIPTEDGNENWFPNKLLLHKRVPIDYDEWYYIVATYNPTVREWESFREDIYETAGPNGKTALKYYPEFWTNNVIPGLVSQTLPPSNYILNCADFPLLFPEDPNSCNVDYCTPADGGYTESLCNNIGIYTHKSEYGARAKVEIIPRSQLLRAKGFRTE